MIDTVETKKILLVEDNQDDAILFNEMLAELHYFDIDLEHVGDMKSALVSLSKRDFDLILLDLSLPDSWGVNTLFKIHLNAPDIPIVILTGTDDDDTAMEAFKAGAYNYLIKDETNSDSLARTIHYSIERHRILNEIEQKTRQTNRQKEFERLQLLSHPTDCPISAKEFGSEPLSNSLPEIFGELVEECEEILSKALEQQALKIDHQLTDRLKAIANRLGNLKGGPKDVMDIYCLALKNKTNTEPTSKSRAYIEEGRMIVLELMGYLACFYRNFFDGNYDKNFN
ncbi:MAG: response regulator [candidate division Zixibacteria bacterium]|nr:response regulator [candidate division Zixibacteria bacterium]